jgi:hypothetical protein
MQNVIGPNKKEKYKERIKDKWKIVKQEGNGLYIQGLFQNACHDSLVSASASPSGGLVSSIPREQFLTILLVIRRFMTLLM